MRIAVVLPSLAGGGMERMRIHLIQEWVRRGIAIDLVISRFQGPLCDRIPETVEVFEVARRHSLLFPFGLRRYLKTRKPTHVLSAANDINAITLLMVRQLGGNISTVISVHNHLSSELALAKGLKKLKARAVVWMLMRIIHHARGVIAVSQGVADDLKQHFSIREDRLHVVYNPVITPETQLRLQEPLMDCPVPTGTPWVVYAGRFVHAKGLDILLDAFEKLAGKTDAHLVLMGDGPLKYEIAAQAKTAGLSDRVHLVGFQSNPLPWMREADMLVLPSRHEGLSNVLIEALACGTQIVAADCPSGPAEILDGGRYGQLVPVEDASALANALLNSLTRKFHIPSDTLTARAQEFTVARAADRYLSSLTEATT